MLFVKTFEAFEKEHELSGAALILDDKILLVNAKKFKDVKNKWSIPKGHIEKDMSEISTAIEELSEEANIHLPLSKFTSAEKGELHYMKNGIKKYLVYFVIKIKKTDIDFKLYNDMILKYYLNKDEIAEAGFFSKQDATELIDKIQLPILNIL